MMKKKTVKFRSLLIQNQANFDTLEFILQKDVDGNCFFIEGDQPVASVRYTKDHPDFNKILDTEFIDNGFDVQFPMFIARDKDSIFIFRIFDDEVIMEKYTHNLNKLVPVQKPIIFVT